MRAAVTPGWLWRFSSALFLIFLVPLVAMGFGMLIPKPFVVSAEEVAAIEAPEESRQILVLSNPIHTDIALPADPDVLKTFSFVSEAGLNLDYPGVYWVIFGWGSRSFYIETPTWADLKARPVFNALTWDASVMHVRRAGDIPPHGQNVYALNLSNKQFEKLLRDIEQSFEVSENGVPDAIPDASYDTHDMFFPAIGGFNALMGCNTWTAKMLRLSGTRTGFWTPLPVALMWSLHLHNDR